VFRLHREARTYGEKKKMNWKCRIIGHSWLAIARLGISPAIIRQKCRRCGDERVIKITTQTFGGMLLDDKVEVIELKEMKKQ
jgi:DNA-binding transcriptional regulator YdaS (Cro superfamily)